MPVTIRNSIFSVGNQSKPSFALYTHPINTTKYKVYIYEVDFLFGVPIPNGPNHFPYDTETLLQATFPFRNPFWPLKSGGNLAVALLATNATPQHHQQEMWEKHPLKPFLG